MVTGRGSLRPWDAILWSETKYGAKNAVVGNTPGITLTSGTGASTQANQTAIGSGFVHPLGLALWLDAADSATISLSGSAVTQWDDKSGNSRHVSQATSGSRPASGTRTVNGLNAIDFDGTDDSLFNTSPFMYALGDCTVFVVAATDLETPEQVIIGEGWSVDVDSRYLFEAGAGPRIRFSFADNTAAVAKDFPGTRFIPAGAPFDATWEMTASTVDMELRRSTDSDTYTRGTMNLDRLAVGAWLRLGSTRFFNGVICEILVYGGILSAPDKALVQSYLRSKWAIACPTYSESTDNSNNLSTIGAIANPAGAVAGDLVTHVITVDNPGATDITGSAGWQASTQYTQGSNVLKGRAFARILTGGGDDTFTPSGPAQDTVIGSTLIKANELLTGFTATNAVSSTYLNGAVSSVNGDPDPPNLDTGISRTYLWFAAGMLNTGVSGGDQISGNPSGYSEVMGRKSAASSTSCYLRMGARSSTAQSEDPGAFTSADLEWIALTIAVPGQL